VVAHIPKATKKDFRFLEELFFQDLNTEMSREMGRIQDLEAWFIRKLQARGILERPLSPPKKKKSK